MFVFLKPISTIVYMRNFDKFDEKYLTYEIWQRKFDRVKGALISVQKR